MPPPIASIDYGTRARFGVLLPSGNAAAEAQFAAMLPKGVAFHVTRLPLTGSSEAELLAMVEGIDDATAMLADVHPDLILFHCTAVSTYSAELEADIRARIARVSGLPCTTTSAAIVASLRHLGARRVAMLSPYGEATNRREADYLASHGFEVTCLAGLDCRSADAMFAVTPERWLEFAHEHKLQGADALLLSCTTTRAVEVAERLEHELGMPVVTSNSAAAWHVLQAMGVPAPVPGYGRLLAAT
jgi:maleate isomerase